MSMNPVKWVMLAGALALAIILALYLDNITVPVGEKPVQYKDLGGRFQLKNLDGNVDLEQYKGKAVVMYFGYLNCAEVCPTSMSIVSAALGLVDPTHYDKVQGFFVSVDPERDDLQSLHEFAQYFDPRILGITGTPEEIQAMTKQYGVYYDLVAMESSQLAYTVDHVSRFYIISPQGELVDSMSYTTTPIELAARIERAIEQNL
ncbi:SCO family protein [Vibrio sonorensis]|uniref:SCO family protein n=1 Tax=Vibrio sonorensis TaxID=1004316 RepID=UPI0008D92FE2|nr:SCO family protein [Vibrio sonorensis]